MIDHYVCLRLNCNKGTGSNLLLYCREHAEEVEREVLFGKQAEPERGA